MNNSNKKRISGAIIIALAILGIAIFCSACTSKKRQYYELSDFGGKTIAVESGTVHAALIMSNDEIKNPQIRYQANNADMVENLLRGKSDAIVTDKIVAMSLEAKYPEIMMLNARLDESAVNGLKGVAISVANSFRRTILENERWLQLLKGLLVTLEVIIITIITSFLLGFILFLIAYSGNRHFITAANGFAHFMTLMPLYSWFLVVYYIMFTSNTSGNMIIAIIALTIETGIFVYMNLMDAVSQVPEGEKEAVYTMGYRKYQGLFKIILPQARTKFLSLMADDIIVHVRGTSLVGTVAVMDLQAVSDLITAETMEPFMPLAITVLAYAGLAELACRGVKKVMHMLNKTERTEEEIRKSIMAGRF